MHLNKHLLNLLEWKTFCVLLGARARALQISHILRKWHFCATDMRTHINALYEIRSKKGEKILYDDERATTTIDNNIKASARNLKQNEKKKTHTLKQNKRKANRHFIW